MTTNHKYYLDLAFQLAEKNLGKTKLNPSVGTVIVKNGSIISSAVTSVNGRPHAEFNALKKGNDFVWTRQQAPPVIHEQIAKYHG